MKIIYEDNCEHALMLNDYDLIYIMNEFKTNGKDLRESVESLYREQFGENIDSYRVWIYYDENKSKDDFPVRKKFKVKGKIIKISRADNKLVNVVLQE